MPKKMVTTATMGNQLFSHEQHAMVTTRNGVVTMATIPKQD
jgi:hypothetical protein